MQPLEVMAQEFQAYKNGGDTRISKTLLAAGAVMMAGREAARAWRTHGRARTRSDFCVLRACVMPVGGFCGVRCCAGQ